MDEADIDKGALGDRLSVHQVQRNLERLASIALDVAIDESLNVVLHPLGQPHVAGEIASNSEYVFIRFLPLLSGVECAGHAEIVIGENDGQLGMGLEILQDDFGCPLLLAVEGHDVIGPAGGFEGIVIDSRRSRL